MTAETIDWPAKRREVQCELVDSSHWNDFEVREGDVVVATWAKTGTTWTQQIVWQLLNGAPDGHFDSMTCPWVDMRVTSAEQLDAVRAQTGRRNLKTHLPIEALVFSPKAKYLYVGRDARDTVWSAYNHQTAYRDPFAAMVNAAPWPVRCPIAAPTCDIREYYLRWLDSGEMSGFGLPYSLWDHVQGWWDVRSLPNVLLVHFDKLKADPRREIGRIADFLGVGVADADWPALLGHCSFSYMREEALKSAPNQDIAEIQGIFYHSGTNGRWKDVLSLAEIARCDEVAARRLTPDCARWMASGEMPD